MNRKLTKQFSGFSDQKNRPQNPVAGKATIYRLVLRSWLPLLLSCFLSVQVSAQPLNAAPISINLELNSGVTVVANAIVPSLIGSFDSWGVNTFPGPYGSALVINPPPVNINACNAWSGNSANNQWITKPSINCGGVPGNYSCSPVTELYFAKTFFVPANSILQIDGGVFASDWVQDIKVNGQWAYNSNIMPPATLDHRQNGVKFKWCNWNYGGNNTIVVHVKANPNITDPTCKVIGMKFESFGTSNYFQLAGPTIVCANSTNLFSGPTATSLGYPATTSYIWNKPGGWSGNSSTYTANLTSNAVGGYTNMTAGIYSITSTYTLCLATGGYSVYVDPMINVTPTGTSVCSGQQAVLSASGAVGYSWYGPGGTLVSSNSTATVFPAVNTTYTVTGTTSLGCTYSKTVAVVVKPLATLNIAATATSVCQGKPVTLTASGTATAYTWLMPPNISTVNPLVVTPSVTTTYTALGVNTNGCVKTSIITIRVLPTPTVTASASPPVVCSGVSTTLTASGAPSYSWSPGTSLSASFSVTPSSTTVYTVTGIGTNGCSNTATVLVTVLSNPVVTANPPFLCPSIINTLTASGALNYTWTIGNSTTTIANTPTITATPGTNNYTVCGSGANNCVACTSMTLVPGSPIYILPTNTVLCTNGSTCINISVTTTLTSQVNYTWQPGNLNGATINVCPTVATVYTVSATSSGGCPSNTTLAVSIASNCCAQSTTGLSVMSNFTGTLVNTAYLLNSQITVSGASQLVNCEVWATPGTEIDILPGAVLDLDHVHMFACGTQMWNGIVVQDGGRITTDVVLTRQKNSMIEDALTAIKLDNISINNSGPNPPIYIQRVVFNRNLIGIQISNSDPGLSFLPLGITGCVFSSRTMPYTTYPSPINNMSWASSEIIPGSPWGNNPGLKVASSATTGLATPYLLNGFPLANLKSPYTTQPGYIGIKIENIGDPNGFAVTQGVDIGLTYPGNIKDDFNLFDDLGNGIDVTDASLLLAANVFQNSQIFSTPLYAAGLFGGYGIQSRTTGLMNTQCLLAMNTFNSANHFWDCMTGVDLYNVYGIKITDATFRSTQSVPNFPLPYMNGEAGIASNTNRFSFGVRNCEFNNLKNGIVFNTNNNAPGYDMTGGGALAGVYSANLNIDENYFGAEVFSANAYSGGAANTSEYMGTAIQLNTPYTPFWANQQVGSSVTSNRIDRAFRGILINSMLTEPLAVGGNSIYIEDDNTFGSPAFGYGIAAYDDARYVKITTNTLQAMGSTPPNTVALVYLNNTLGVDINCNRVRNSQYGFLFDGDNTGTAWVTNTMCTNYYGMALVNNGIIGQQLPGVPSYFPASDNYWDPNCGVTWGTTPAPNETWIDNSSPLLSILNICTVVSGVPQVGYVPTNNNNSVPLGPVYTLGSSIYPVGSHNFTLNCSASYPAPPAWRLSGQTISALADSVFNTTSVNIYPNPTNGILNIDFPEQKESLTATVTDITGKVVLVVPTITNENNSLDVTQLPPAMYIVELKSGRNKALRYKLIKVN